MTDPSKLTAEAAAINRVTSPHVHTFAVDAAANIVAHDQRLAALEIEVAKLTQPVPPPPVSSVWAWDATKATVDPQSAAKVAAFQTYAIGTGVYFVAGCAHADAPTGTPFYSIPMQEAGKSMSCPVPLGTRPGCTADASLTVRYATGVAYDFGNASYNAGTRMISGAFGIATVQPGAVDEDGPNSANAAGFPLAAGLVTPDDVRAGVIAHPLTMAIPNVGAAPNPYPARPGSAGYTGNTGLPLGTWLRVNPASSSDPTLTAFELMLRRAAGRYGVFVRDINPSDVSINGADQVNQGGNAVDWPAVGVTLPIPTRGGMPYALKLNPATFAGLQVLQPPTP